jgi:hypothetical protein
VPIVYSDTSIQAISIALDLALVNIFTERLRLAQGQLTVAATPGTGRLKLSNTAVYDPVNLIFSEN